MENLKKYLLEAAGKEKDEISPDNPYRQIALDGENPRLGWVKPVDFGQIKESIESISSLLKNKENFIFIGMGGSINGIKPLLATFEQKNFFTLDNLDPKAVKNILFKIGSIEKTLVIAISKSGTTQETQLLSKTLKSYLSDKLGSDKWQNNFLWLTDPSSFKKLDDLGWEQTTKLSIQADGHCDVGGRFSSPLTQIFILPLFLLLNQDFNTLEKFYSQFIASQEEILQKAYQVVFSLGDDYDFHFSPTVDKKWGESFASWVVQLFQESLGSKLPEKSVKTVVNIVDSGFIKLQADFSFSEPAVSIMAQMYFYQLFIAFLSGRWNINFVSQEFVEKYKQKMRSLEKDDEIATTTLEGDIEGLVEQINKKIKNEQSFIEVVLYFVPEPEFISLIEKKCRQKFPEKIILNFVGSDWNHQSYQAAFGDENTFYALVCLSRYEKAAFISKGQHDQNVKTLKRIALATQQTLSDKSILYSFQNNLEED